MDINKLKNIRAKCLIHSGDLLRSSKLLLKEGASNIAYHLSVLALEEIGKGEMLVVGHHHPNPAKSVRILKSLEEDHSKKLFWALWGPTHGKKEMSKEQIQSFVDLSDNIHLLRLRGLYVDLNDEMHEPAKAISAAEAESLINITEARLKMAECVELKEPSQEVQEDFNWFLAASENPEDKRLIFGSKSIEKLKEFGDSAKWVRWLREQFDEAEKERQELLKEELNRKEPEEDEEKIKEKWRVRYKLLTPSHSIRENVLKDWNKKIDKLKFYMGKREGKTSILIVETVLPKAVPLQALWYPAWGEARRQAVSLNIATRGLFWWYLPKDVGRFYESIIDLESSREVVVERSPKLSIDWGNNVLKRDDLELAIVCYRFLPRDNEDFLNCYVTGISFMGKNDIHTPFEHEIFLQFYHSLVKAIEFYKDRIDGLSIEENIEKIFESLMPGSSIPKEYAIYARELLDHKTRAITLTECGGMKILFDNYVLSKVIELAKKDDVMGKMFSHPSLEERETASGT